MLRIAVSVGVLLLAGCGAERSRGPSTPNSSPTTSTGTVAPPATTQAAAPIYREGCPETPGARVATESVEHGAALVFTAPEDVAALRVRVSEMAMPVAMQKSERRLDNIHNGVRLVFEANDTKEVTTLREAVGENARQIAQRCGLIFAAPPERKAPPPSTAAQKTPPKSEDDAKAKDAAERAKKDAAKTEPPPKPKEEPKDKPKEAPKPKPSDKPPEPEKPKEEDKPKPPPPPEPPPGPILPRPQ